MSMHFIFRNLSLSGLLRDLLSSVWHTSLSSHSRRGMLPVCLCQPRVLGSNFDSDLSQDPTCNQCLNITLVLAQHLKAFDIFIIHVLLIFCPEDKSTLFFVLCKCSLFLIKPLLNAPTQRSSLISSFRHIILLFEFHQSLSITSHLLSLIQY